MYQESSTAIGKKERKPKPALARAARWWRYFRGTRPLCEGNV